MTTSSDSNHVYYNFRINANADGSPTLAKYSENRVTAILDKPSDYEMAVMRFSVPSTNIPLFFWRDNYFGITLTHAGTDYFQYLQFIPNTSVVGARNTIYSVQEVVDSFNQAFATAFALIPGGSITSTQPPQMQYDPVTDLLSLNVEQTYLTDGIDIYWNQALNSYLYSFQNFYNEDPPSEKVFRWIVRDRGNNSSTVGGQPSFLMTQDYPNSFAWNALKGLKFESNSIPVVHEMEGGQKDIQSLFLTDFEVIKSRYDRNAISFWPRGPVRFTDLKSDAEMKRIDVSVSWIDTDNVAHPLYITGSDSLTIKILFRKKMANQLIPIFEKLEV